MTGPSGVQGFQGVTGPSGPVGQGFATLVTSETKVLGPGEIGYMTMGLYNALPTMQMGNVARVDSIYGLDSTGFIGGLPFQTIQGAITAIGSTQGVTIWVLPGTYDISPTGSNATITDNYGVVWYPLITLPVGTSLRGLSTQTTTIRCQTPTQNTILLNMATNTRVEDLTLTLGSASYTGTYDLMGLYFGSDSTTNCKLRTAVVNVNNSNVLATDDTNVYGVLFDGSGGLSGVTFSYNSLKGSTINVYSNGLGNKRGILVSNSNVATTRDLNVYVAKPRIANSGTGSYVGVETNNTTGGSIQLRSTTIGTIRAEAGETYIASDILQTTPSTIINPTYLASAGIQIGPGTDLVTKSAGGRGFSTYIYPTTLYYGCRGTISNTRAGWLWVGSNLFTNSNPNYPDTTSPPARYRAQQPFICSGISVSCNVGVSGANTLTITICKNSTGLAPGGVPDGSTSMQIILNSTYPTNRAYYDTSVDFNAGDFLSVYFQTDSSQIEDVSVQVDCF